MSERERSMVLRKPRSGTYARGTMAVGECARSGRKMLLKDMVKDPRTGLMVDPRWKEHHHPLETLPDPKDPQALRNPAPSRDNDGGTTASPSDFLDALPHGGHGFGT